MNKIDKKIKNYISRSNNLKPIKDWGDFMSPIMVSVHCLVYNQEKFIEVCLNSMLDQMVDFPVEIIVHDDNSSDKSKFIIDKYKKLYPNVIKVIYENNNIFSKTGNFLEISHIMVSQSRGYFIALCEGDDYWCDKYKLISQYFMLSNYANCRFCVHKVNVINETNIKCPEYIPSFRIKSCFMNDTKFIKLVNSVYPFQTSSYFFYKEDLLSLFNSNLEYVKVIPNDDEILLRFFGSLGKTVIINKPLSSYRVFLPNSWSLGHSKSDEEKKRMHSNRHFFGIELFNRDTNYKYSKSCDFVVKKYKVMVYLNTRNYKEILLNKELRRTLFKLNIVTYFKVLFTCFNYRK